MHDPLLGDPVIEQPFHGAHATQRMTVTPATDCNAPTGLAVNNNIRDAHHLECIAQ